MIAPEYFATALCQTWENEPTRNFCSSVAGRAGRYETARLHHARWRRGCRLAARRPRAAAGAAGGRVPRAARRSPHSRILLSRFGAGSEGSGLRRGAERRHRISLCGESKRSPAGAGGGIAWHPGRRAGGEQRCSGRGQGGNDDGADRLRGRRRSGQGRPRRQPQPARWQHHWCVVAQRPDRGETTGTAAPDRSQDDDDWHARWTSTVREPRRSEQTCKPRPRRSVCNSSLSTSAATATSTTAIASFVQRGAGALLVGAGAFFDLEAGTVSPHWQRAMPSRRCTWSAREPWPAG